MKRKILTVTIILSMLLSTLIPLSVSAATSGKCGDNLTWKLSNGTLTISGTGTMWDWKVGNNAPWSGNAESIKKVVINDGVTSIGNQAFWQWYENLTSVTLSDSVTSIGEYAFYLCENLSEISIFDGVTNIKRYAFGDCKSLKTVYYSSSKSKWNTIKIDSGNTDLTNATIHYQKIEDSGICGNNLTWNLNNGILTISGTGNMWNWGLGNNAPWRNYDGTVKKVIINSGVTNIGESAFAVIDIPYIQIPDSVISIENSAFEKNDGLTDIELPASVKEIGEYAFYSCSGLENIKMPTVASNIGYYAFAECVNLKSITIPNGITRIEQGMFQNCSSLTSIIIPDTVTSVGNYAFQNCNKLSTVYYGGSKDDWEKLSISSIYNDCLIGANIVYNYNQINVSKNNTSYSVNPICVGNGNVIIFVCYNGDKMVYVNPYVYAGETTIPFTTTETYDKVKVMVWENLETCMPLCEAEDVPLN